MSRLELATFYADSYARFGAVEAVALGGSVSSGTSAADSDIDLYVYGDEPVSLTERRQVVALRPSDRPEVGNAFWEPGDEWVDSETGIAVDVMFRHTGWIEDRISAVLVRHEASLGYTTCFWHNVKASRVLFDRHGWFAQLQRRCDVSYPEPLRQAILAKNRPVLRANISSYEAQIAKAIGRNDWVSVNHRLAVLLASVFDILFALNRVTHPGEKRLLEYVEKVCPVRPEDFRCHVESLLQSAADRSGKLGVELSRFLDVFEGDLFFSPRPGLQGG
jgi:hypothetical protein